MKNPNGVNLIKGEWYLVSKPVSKCYAREATVKEVAMKNSVNPTI